MVRRLRNRKTVIEDRQPHTEPSSSWPNKITILCNYFSPFSHFLVIFFAVQNERRTQCVYTHTHITHSPIAIAWGGTEWRAKWTSMQNIRSHSIIQNIGMKWKACWVRRAERKEARPSGRQMKNDRFHIERIKSVEPNMHKDETGGQPQIVCGYVVSHSSFIAWPCAVLLTRELTCRQSVAHIIPWIFLHRN